MKLRNRILAILLTVVMVLTMIPATLAAGAITVTLVSPAGSKTVSTAADGKITLPAAEEYEGYWFACWITEPVKATDGSDLKTAYQAGDEAVFTEDITLYALYGYEDSKLDVPCFYWTDNLDDYTGEYAILGYDVDYDAEDYIYDAPVVLGEKGQVVDVVREMGATVDTVNFEFYAHGESIVFYFELQEDGTYTIRNKQTGKYLSLSGSKMTFVSSPDAYAYWEILLDSYGFEYIFNAESADMVLLYDYVEESFVIYDNGKTYDDEYYPTDYFFINLYARETAIYMYTTEVAGGETVEPTEPTEPTDPTEPEECVHEWNDGRIIDMPTCEEAGVKIITCLKCGETKTVEAGKILCASRNFTDLDTTSWYHLGVDDMLGRGLMNGMSDTEFRPDVTLNRAMVATVLYRVAGEPAVEGTGNFTDVEENTWYSKAVAWAQAEGIVTGYTDNSFKPMKEITRQELAVMLVRYAKAAGYSVDTTMDLTAYPDETDVAQWAREAVVWAVENGLINGVLTNGVSYLKPQNNATRAQFATIMSRFLEGK